MHYTGLDVEKELRKNVAMPLTFKVHTFRPQHPALKEKGVASSPAVPYYPHPKVPCFVLHILHVKAIGVMIVKFKPA